MLGLSGGIDSTLVALIAADALGAGPGDVRRDAVAAGPRRARSRDARELADNLGVEHVRPRRSRRRWRSTSRCSPTVRGPRAGHHRGEPPGAHPRQPADGALEQVRLARADHRQQVRGRRRLLDAVRRHRGRLRGDQGRAEDARLPARRLPQRARRRAPGARSSIIDRPPSAELRPDQKDSDSLPDYDTLDAILEAYVEEDADREQLAARWASTRRSSTA